MTQYPTRKLSEIKPHPKNPRTHDKEQIKKIAKSIKELGWGRPLILSSDGYILAGHGAYYAAKDELGYTTAPIKQMEHKHDSPEALAYMIADNRLTDESDWNYGDLEIVFEDLKLEHFDLTLTGFDDADNIIPTIYDEDIPDEEQEFDESIADTVEMVKCPECGHEFPK